MPTGIQVINNSGTVLIDENYANLAMKAKGTATLDGTLFRASPAMSGVTRPLIALAGSQYMGVKHVASALTSFTVQGENPSASVPYYIFDLPTAVSNQGLQIFNAAGVLVFDSGNKYARVVDVFGGANLADWNGLRTYTAGRNYAVICLKRAYRKQVVQVTPGNYDITWYMSGHRVVSNTVQGKMVIYKEDNVSAGSAPAQVTDYSGQFAVIDVTGY